MSKKVRGLVLGLIALGVFWLLVCVVALSTEVDKEPFIATSLWAFVGIASGLMVWHRIPGAKVLGIMFAIPMFLAFPLGTFIAWKIVHELRSDEARRYLEA